MHTLTPLICWCIFFCLGIVAGDLWSWDFYWLLMVTFVSLVLGCLFVRRKILSLALIALAAFLLGASDMRLARRIEYPEGAVSVEARVVSTPRILRNAVSFLAHIPGAGPKDILVRSYQVKDVASGDRVRLGGCFYTSPRGLTFIVPKAGFLQVLEHRVSLKKRMQAIFFKYLDPLPAGLYSALVLGDKELVPRPIKEAMIATGTWHIMVVSGSHTALLAVIFLAIFKMVGVPRRLRYVMAMAMLVGYCGLTGASSPVQRATVMTIAFLTSFLIERNPLFFHAMALAALIILVPDPTALFDAGFGLSFLSVFFIATFFPRIYPRGLVDRWWGHSGFRAWLAHGFLSCCIISCCAWVGTAPFIAAVFGRLSLVTVPANVVVVPLAMIVTASGLVLLAAGLAVPIFAPVFAQACTFCLWLMLKANALWSHFSFASVDVPRIPVGVVMGLYAGLIWGLSRLPQQSS